MTKIAYYIKMTHACPKLPHKQSASLFIDNVFCQLQQFKVILNNFRFILSTSGPNQECHRTMHFNERKEKWTFYQLHFVTFIIHLKAVATCETTAQWLGQRTRSLGLTSTVGLILLEIIRIFLIGFLMTSGGKEVN